MTREQLVANIRSKRSFLCVGLDTDLEKIPKHLLNDEDPMFSFNKAIIEATAPYAVAYKFNIAFYEAEGVKGWQSLEKSLACVPDDILIIADAKRGDIGNTAERYATAFYDKLNCDAVTIAPYMGRDSVFPFLGRPGKWAIVLGLTSNPGADDFERLEVVATGRPNTGHSSGAERQPEQLYERVISKCTEWGSADELMLVMGATRPEALAKARELAPDHFFLVPGVGAQGGDLASVAKHGMNKDCGLLVNSSRGIIYASSGKDFAEASSTATQALQQEMDTLLLR